MTRGAHLDAVDYQLILKVIKQQGPPAAYETAIKYAKRVFESMRKYADGKLTPEMSIVWKRVRELEECIHDIERINDRIDWAKRHWVDSEALKIFLCERLREHQPLSPELMDACADILDGTIKPPKAKRGGGYLNKRRDFILAAILWLVCEHFPNIKPGKNRERGKNHATPHDSGADIVAKAAGETFDIVDEAYAKYKKFFIYIKAVEIEAHYSRTGIVQKTYPFPDSTNS